MARSPGAYGAASAIRAAIRCSAVAAWGASYPPQERPMSAIRLRSTSGRDRSQSSYGVTTASQSGRKTSP